MIQTFTTNVCTYLRVWRNSHVHSLIHSFIHTYIDTHIHLYLKIYIYIYTHEPMRKTSSQAWIPREGGESRAPPEGSWEPLRLCEGCQGLFGASRVLVKCLKLPLQRPDLKTDSNSTVASSRAAEPAVRLPLQSTSFFSVLPESGMSVSMPFNVCSLQAKAQVEQLWRQLPGHVVRVGVCHTSSRRQRR